MLQSCVYNGVLGDKVALGWGTDAVGGTVIIEKQRKSHSL